MNANRLPYSCVYITKNVGWYKCTGHDNFLSLPGDVTIKIQ